MPCDLDLGDAARPRRGRGALRRAGARAARRARRRRHRPRRLARAAGGPRAAPRRRRPPVELDVRLPAHRLHAGRARRARAADHRRRRLRRADARRGPPADGHRLRPAGRRPRLPAARRPRALPGGLRRARRRARPPAGERLDQQEASVERFLELTGDDFPETAAEPSAAAVRRVTLVTAIVFGAFVFLGISLLLARWLTGPGAERARVLDAAARAGPRRRRRGARALPACARRAGAARGSRASGRAARSAARRRSRSSPTARRCAYADARDRHRPRGLAGRDVAARRAVRRRRRREGTAAGGGVELLRDLEADRPRGVLLTAERATSRRALCSHAAMRRPASAPPAPLARAAALAAPLPGAAAAADSPPTKTALPRRAVGPLPDRRHVAVPPRPGNAGLRSGWQRSRRPRAGRRDRPQRVERRGRLARVDDRRRRLVPQGLPLPSAARRSRGSCASSRSTTARASGSTATDRVQPRRLPARSSCASAALQRARDEPPRRPRRQPPPPDRLPALGPRRQRRRRPAAGGTTAGSCARSTSRLDRVDSKTVGWSAAAVRALHGDRAGPRAVRNLTAAAERVRVTGRFGSRRLNLGSAGRRRRRRAVHGRVRVPGRGCGRRPDRTSTTSAHRAGGRAHGRSYAARPASARSASPARPPALNGQPVNLRGVGVHEDSQEQGLRGRQRVPQPAHVGDQGDRRDADARPLPAAPPLQELADEQGVMFWSEIPVYALSTQNLRPDEDALLVGQFLRVGVQRVMRAHQRRAHRLDLGHEPAAERVVDREALRPGTPRARRRRVGGHALAVEQQAAVARDADRPRCGLAAGSC